MYFHTLCLQEAKTFEGGVGVHICAPSLIPIQTLIFELRCEKTCFRYFLARTVECPKVSEYDPEIPQSHTADQLMP